MKAHIPTANPVLTIPEELKDKSKQIKFAYTALRNMIYSFHINTGNSADASDFAITLTNSFCQLIKDNNVCMFKSDSEMEELCQLLCSFNRNVLNRNEHIIMLHNQLRPHKGTTKNQLLTIYCQLMLECSLQMHNGILTQSIVEGVYDELMKKMLIATNPMLKQFFVTDIVDVFNKI